MPEQGKTFPASITLNGADYFLLQLDLLMWKLGRQRNICTFAVTLQERIEFKDLAQHLTSNLSYQWISRLRLQKGWPFALAKWNLKLDLALPEINQFQLEKSGDLPASLFNLSFDVSVDPAFQVSLCQLPKGAGSTVVFSWHHALMDAHGGETFIHHLGGLGELTSDLLVSDKESVLPLKERANIALQMKEFLCDISRLPIASLGNTKKLNSNVRYRILSFSQQQSTDITIRASQQGAGFLVSAFYLAVIACAIANVQRKRASMEDDILIPIPLDRRKRGLHSPIMGNQVTFLFYRIPNKALTDIKTCVVELVEQMKTLMRYESPAHFLVMMDFLRRVPGWLYRMQLTSPTKGEMASFYYSDTGDSLDLYDELLGSKVTSAIHYPPNMFPPGITFVLSRNQGALQLTFAYMQSVINEEEVEMLLQQINTGLLGTVTD